MNDAINLFFETYTKRGVDTKEMSQRYILQAFYEFLTAHQVINHQAKYLKVR